jgi:hypothetical protein
MPILQAAFRALEFRVARQPEAGVHFSDNLGGMFIMISSEAVDSGGGSTPTAKIVYRFNSVEVAIMAAAC